MFESIRTRVLRLFRVPHDPDPPTGAPGSVRVFRAGRNFYKLRLIRWGLGQAGALVGIIVSLNVLKQIQLGVTEVRTEVRQEINSPTKAVNQPSDVNKGNEAPVVAAPKAKAKSRQDRTRITLRRVAERWPWWLFPLIMILEGIGICLYVIQIPITYAMARLDYELRWYIVTDRSLRIRAGLASVKETTMSFANVQQVAVSQGPLQRLLGIADLRVQSAGGGGDHSEHGGGESLHTGVFHGVDNANEIRDLILERLRVFRQAGLGDPDDAHAGSNSPLVDSPTHSTDNSALLAAREVLHEARALRQALR